VTTTPFHNALALHYLECHESWDHVHIVKADENHAVLATVSGEEHHQFRITLRDGAIVHREVDCTVCAHSAGELGSGCDYTPPDPYVGERGGYEVGDCAACIALRESMRREPTSSQMADYIELHGGRW
jgi:hypothetical protein